VDEKKEKGTDHLNRIDGGKVRKKEKRFQNQNRMVGFTERLTQEKGKIGGDSGELKSRGECWDG